MVMLDQFHFISGAGFTIKDLNLEVIKFQAKYRNESAMHMPTLRKKKRGGRLYGFKDLK